jgi:hypothetical protein
MECVHRTLRQAKPTIGLRGPIQNTSLPTFIFWRHEMTTVGCFPGIKQPHERWAPLYFGEFIYTSLTS